MIDYGLEERKRKKQEDMFRDYYSHPNENKAVTRFHLHVMLCLCPIQSDGTVKLCESLIEDERDNVFSLSVMSEYEKNAVR